MKFSAATIEHFGQYLPLHSLKPRTRKILACALFAIMIDTAILSAVKFHFRDHVFNFTTSEPWGLYKTRPPVFPLQAGQAILFCPPDTPIFQIARERKYTKRGSCPSGDAPYLKTIGAVPFDAIEMEKYVSINGQAIEHARIRFSDSQGRPMPVYEGGTLLSTEYFMLSTHSQLSFDSRYFGPIRQRHIIAIAEYAH